MKYVIYLYIIYFLSKNECTCDRLFDKYEKGK